MEKVSLTRSLLSFGFLQGLSNLAYYSLAFLPPSEIFLASAVAVENFCGGLGTTAYTALLMRLCSFPYTGTQYALFTSFMALTRTVLTPISGWGISAMGFKGFYLLSFFLSFPGLYFAWKIPPTVLGIQKAEGIKNGEENQKR